MNIDAKRTPDSRFENLPGFPYKPHYIDDLPGYEGLRVAYIDEGPGTAGHIYLCLHGQPSWSYLYRKMIPVFLRDGGRVIALDWLGFGRSDKPIRERTYSFNFHRNMLIEFITRLDLRRITLVCQDWGGLIGLTIPMEMPHRFKRLLIMNTMIAIGQSPGEGFDAWKAYNAANPDLDIAALMKRAEPTLSEAEAAAYSAPFPDTTYKSGVRRFPEMVMTDPDMEGADLSRQAAGWWHNTWDRQSFMAIGMRDPVLGPGVMQKMRRGIKGCPPPMEVPEAGHFVQEHGDKVAEAALARWASEQKLRR